MRSGWIAMRKGVAAQACEEPGEAALGQLQALEALGRGRLSPVLVDEMAAALGRARQRLAHSRDHIVVAFAGGTGSGKSSLVNALVGRTLSSPGVRRPTTDHALAVGIGDAEERSEPLLDWLQVYDRHTVPAEGGVADLEGALLLDLPDVDSVVHEHWEVAERLIDRCDLLVWVMDPLKYAHALAYESYFARLAHHAEVLLVVLNHVDRLSEAERDACQAHLHELLEGHGLGAAELLPVAAITGEGVDALRQRIAVEVRERRAPLERIRADVAALVTRSIAELPASEVVGLDAEVLAAAQRKAINETELLAEAEAAYRSRAEQATASPLRRSLGVGLAKLRRRPTGNGAADGGERLAPSVAEAQVRQGILQAVQAAAERFPEPAAERLRRLAAAAAAPLAEDLRQRLAERPLEPRLRLWWRGVGMLRGFGEAAAGLGAGWLASRGVVAWLALPPVPVPEAIGEVSWPWALLAGGASVSVALGMMARPLIALGARRHRGALERVLVREARATDSRALADVREELAHCQQLSDQAYRAAAHFGSLGRR
ncbi:MAG: GTPase family protein [Halorhodospira sp.]